MFQDHLKKKDSQKKLQSDVISTIKERRLCYIKVAPPKYVQDESLDAIEVKPDINHLMIFEDHFEQPCCVCMEDKQTHYSVNEKWDGLTIEDVIEFTTGLRVSVIDIIFKSNTNL